MIETIYNNDVQELAKMAGEKVNELFQDSEGPILFLTSAGSALPILEHINANNLSSKITIGVLDERYSSDQNVNNFATFMQTSLYMSALAKECKFIDTRVQNNERLDGMAIRFERELRNWKEKNPDGVIIATQGMGQDGHTSGIMPYPENPEFFKVFEDENRWVVGYDAKEKNQYPLRVTTTIPFLKLIDYVVFFTTGEKKKVPLQKALENNTKLNEVPANVITQMKNVFLFTDINLS